MKKYAKFKNLIINTLNKSRVFFIKHLIILSFNEVTMLQKLKFLFFLSMLVTSNFVRAGDIDVVVITNVTEYRGLIFVTVPTLITSSPACIIDDFKKDVYTKQKNNCILAPPFEFTHENSHDDKFLKELSIKLEEFLKDKNNLKKHIHNINKETIEKYKI